MKRFVVLCAVLIAQGSVALADKKPTVMATEAEIDLNAREGQVSVLQKDTRIPSAVRDSLKRHSLEPWQSQIAPTPAINNTARQETIVKVDKAHEHFYANTILSGLITYEARAGAFFSGTMYLAKSDLIHLSANSYRIEPLWKWSVFVNGKAPPAIEDQDRSRALSVVSVRRRGPDLWTPSNTDDAVAVVGAYRERELASENYGRLSFLNLQGDWGFDQIFTHKDIKKAEFVDAVYLDRTNELLILGNADSKIWLLKFDIPSKWALWDRVYDLTKFRLHLT